MRRWTNDEAIRRWAAFPREVLDAMESDGDFSRPDWTGAMKACADALAPGGLFVLSVIHPCFEQLAPSWRDHGEYRVREYFAEYEIPGPYASSFHRSLSAYLNELVRLGCQLREIAEPALDPATAAAAGPSAEAYSHLPNFLVVAARRS
jgi:hypothetical protein